MYYNVPVTISKQEDGLWRATVPGIAGCWVDCPTLEQALAEIHEVFALFAGIYDRDGEPLPAEVLPAYDSTFQVSIPIAVLDDEPRRRRRRYDVLVHQATHRRVALRRRREDAMVPEATLAAIAGDSGLTLQEILDA